jgi:hypothetical protein
MREESTGNDGLEMLCREGSSDAGYVFSGQDQECHSVTGAVPVIGRLSRRAHSDSAQTPTHNTPVSLHSLTISPVSPLCL